MTKEIIEIALKSAFQLGQTYWRQADSDRPKDHDKSDDTMAAFKTLVTNTITNIAQPVQPTKVEPTAQPIELWEQLVSLGQEVDTQPAERNFCQRCGQRLGDADHIHTCSPPVAATYDSLINSVKATP